MDKYAPGSTSNRRRIWGISTPYVSPQNQVWQGCLKAENRTEARGRRDERDRKSMGLQEWKRQMGGIKAQCWGAGAGGALHMERIGGVCQIWKGHMWTVNRNYKIRIKTERRKRCLNSLRSAWKKVEVYLVCGAVSESLTNEDHIEAVAISGSQPPDQQHFSGPWRSSFIDSAFTSPQYVTFWSATFCHPVCYKLKPHAPLTPSTYSKHSIIFKFPRLFSVHTTTIDVKGFGSIDEVLFKSIWIDYNSQISFFLFVWCSSSRLEFRPAPRIWHPTQDSSFPNVLRVYGAKYNAGPNLGCLLDD